ncbi:MAG: tyrosine-type recombinase/integrase [Proteobacteria bacterium]|nr:tyrosine-type recombinase/integrase [Pseudomonadota bacterium]
MKLTATTIKNAKATGKLQKLADGGGLYLEVTAKGNKRWRYRYYFQGKEQLISLGIYPDISLKDARERHAAMRRLLANDINPSDTRKAEKASQAGAESFEAIAREWHNKNLHMWTERHGQDILRRLELNIFPWLGKKPINDITPPALLAVLRRMEDRGAVETAHRVKACCGQVFRYAIATGRAERDASQDLKGAIPPVKKKHLASITDPVKIGELLRSIDGYEGSFVVKSALRLAPLVFVRPKELRCAEWSEFDFDKAEWRIPAEKMKARVQHIVPLSRQAIEVLQELYPLTGHGKAAKYVFPSPRTLSRPLSDNGVLSALRRMGYAKEEMTGHGFRSMASTLLNEQGWNADAIERQLAHGERNTVRAAYNYAQYMDERREMMQAWADYLDELRAGGKVITAKFGG